MYVEAYVAGLWKEEKSTQKIVASGWTTSIKTLGKENQCQPEEFFYKVLR